MLTDFQEFEEFLARCTNYERIPSFAYDNKTLGLERVRGLVAELGNPHEGYPSIHIGGTKGKGSTSLMLEALLQSAGYTVGTYTSPHVEHLRERIRIGGRPADEDGLLREINRVLPTVERRRKEDPRGFPTFFELMTALAMALYKTRRVDWGVFEVGLGGRLDATNILAPTSTAITSIGLEHSQQLGKTLRSVAREKAGIIKPGTPIVLGPLPTDAAEEIYRIARERSAPVVPVDEKLVRTAGPGKLSIAGHGVVPAGPVVGPALRLDLGIALTLFQQVPRQPARQAGGEKSDTEVIVSALAGLSLPARVETFPTEPKIIVDSAHTAASIRALRFALSEIGFPEPRTLVFSMARGKEIPAILEQLPEIADEIIFTRADAARSIDPATLREQLGRGEVIVEPTAAFDKALSRGHAVVVTGSFYLAGALRSVARKMALVHSER
jgi:dihydrofolate synthase/folylpolyglutamate synthase